MKIDSTKRLYFISKKICLALNGIPFERVADSETKASFETKSTFLKISFLKIVKHNKRKITNQTLY